MNLTEQVSTPVVFNPKSHLLQKPKLLNKEQQVALDAALKGESLFITGPGGVGKTFLVNEIVEKLTDRGRRVAVTALTGCAALLLGSSAKTLHSWAGIGLGKDSAGAIIHGIQKYNFPAKKRWICTDTLIIDEVSMLTPDLLEKLNEVAMGIRRKMLPFGGLQVIFVGDFYQLPPVYIESESCASKPSKVFAFESQIWNDLGLHVVHLTKIVRQADPTFHKVLMEARDGCLTDSSLQILLDRKDQPWEHLKIRPTLLFSRRAEVDMINEINLKNLTTVSKVYEVKTIHDATFPKGLEKNSERVTKALAKLDRSAPYKTSLELKIGAQVMLIYNIDTEKGLVNGSRGVVEGFTETIPPQPLVLFQGAAKAIPVGEQSWPSEDVEGLKRSQIPLILAYAVTIHKSQGATLDSALIDIGVSTFEVGQAYVALSRVKSLDSLYVYDLDPNAFKSHPKVKKFYDSLH
jgi:ATP-dependent DNA helicase PIF1